MSNAMAILLATVVVTVASCLFRRLDLVVVALGSGALAMLLAIFAGMLQ